jgi:hypothetical protein
MFMWHWFLHYTGTNNTSGPWYGFWSGFGSDLGEFAIVGGMFALVRKHTCEVHGCWRLGRHTTAAGHAVCRRHHPDGPLTAEDIRRKHEDALSAKSSADAS